MLQTAKLGVKSFINFFSLSLSGSLLLSQNRTGSNYKIDHQGVYQVFRETVCLRQLSLPPSVLVIGFRLRFIGSSPLLHYLFQRTCILTTPFWSGFTGFHIKLWMVNPSTKNYLGIYEWYGRKNAEIYINTLTKILTSISTPHSVWHRIISPQKLGNYLKKHNITN